MPLSVEVLTVFTAASALSQTRLHVDTFERSSRLLALYGRDLD